MKLVYTATRDAYGIEDICCTMTAGELIHLLQNYDEATPVVLSFDNGYTYGGLTERGFEEVWDEEGDSENAD